MMNRINRVTALLTFGLLLSGTSAPAGWPAMTLPAAGQQANVVSSPLVFDLDGDGFLEVAALALDDKVYLWNHDGSLRGGWPYALNFSDGTVGSLALANLNGNGQLGLVAFGDDSTSQDASVVVLVVTPGTTQDTITRKSLTLPATSDRQTGKCTPAVINCLTLRNSNPHPGEEILVRDGRGFIHVIQWDTANSSLQFVTPSGGLDTLPTSGDDPTGDLYNLHPINPSVSVYDLGDGETLVAAGSTNGKVYSWVLETTGTGTLTKTNHLTFSAAAGGFYGSPVLADLDPDTDSNLDLDIIVGGTDGKVYVWEIWGGSNGLRTGWPKSAVMSDSLTPSAIYSSPAVANLDGPANPNLEIAIGSNDDHVYLFRANGDFVFASRGLATKGDVISSPLIVDLNGGGALEILSASLDGNLYAWDSDGDPLTGWPKRMNSPGIAAPVVADLHTARRRSVVAASQEGQVFCFDLSSRFDSASSGWMQFRGDNRRQGAVPTLTPTPTPAP